METLAKHRSAWLLTLAALASACDGSTPTTPVDDVPGDTSALDVSVTPDVASDLGTPDARADSGPDVATDNGPDVAADSGPDATDATPDVPADATADAQTDAADVVGDVTVDVTVDGTADVAADAAPDVTTDVADAGADVVADATPDAGAPTELWVLRVGEGTTALSNASTALFIDRRSAVDGAMMGATIALPTAMTGANRPITLSGSAGSEGALTRSVDGRFVTLAGYATAPGLASVASSAATAVQRVVGRVARDGVVDTRTALGTLAYGGNNVRSAVTVDGSAFWVGGAGTTTAGGVLYQPLGATTDAVNVLATPPNVRSVNIFGGQLYATTSTSAINGLLSVGTGTPTASGASGTLLSGFSAATSSSLYGFAAFDRDPAVAGVDTIYVGDDRAPAAGAGGVQRWTLTGTTWALSATLNQGLTAGVRGLTAWVDGDATLIAAITVESPARLVLFRDRAGVTPGDPTVLATAATNTQLRGVALAPRP